MTPPRGIGGVEVPPLPKRSVTPMPSCAELNACDARFATVATMIASVKTESDERWLELTKRLESVNSNIDSSLRKLPQAPPIWHKAITPGVFIAVITLAGTLLAKRMDAAQNTNAIETKIAIAVGSAIPEIERRTQATIAETAKAIEDERERRERQRPTNKDPDKITIARRPIQR